MKSILSQMILHLETTSAICSVCLAQDGQLVTIAEDVKAFSHSSAITTLIEQVINTANLKGLDEIDAVAISSGPGSYTGLRIGTATAKGICYALKKPLIAVPTLYSMAELFLMKNSIEPDSRLIPCIDARRMEVYSAVFDQRLNQLRETRAEIIDEHSYSEYASEEHKIYFIGDAAQKLRPILKLTGAVFHVGFNPTSEGMIKSAFRKFQSSDFEDIAMFEPFYLKDFIAVSKSQA